MRIGINKVHFPVTTLGFGRRIGLWMQGCSIRCPECISQDTWAFDPDKKVEIEYLMREMTPWFAAADGITISGGEPFDQPECLDHLLLNLLSIVRGDIIVYSGYSCDRLFSRYPDILAFIDVLISEPFEAGAGHSLVLRGSDNQKIFLMTALAKSRYASDIDQCQWNGKRRLDAVVDGDALWLAGIPTPGAMESLRTELARRGMGCSTSDQYKPMVRA